MLPLFGINILACARDGEEAISIFKTLAKKPDFIIMDHRLPIKDGIETMEEILELDQSSKVIFASADQKIATLALARGAISFLQKPFLMKHLAVLIKEKASAEA